MPYIWKIGFPRYAEIRKVKEAIFQQRIFTAAIQTALFGAKPLTFESVLGQEKDEWDASSHERRYLENFPYDVKFLSTDSVAAARDAGRALERQGFRNIWTPERVEAAIGTDILARRAAQEDRLWERFWRYKQAGIPITQDLLLKFARELFWDRALTPPGYFQDQCRRAGIDPTLAWERHIEACNPGVITQIREAMTASWTQPIPTDPHLGSR